jgi:membrane-associated protein
MEFLLQVLDWFRHIDVHLAELARDYGPWIYGILFLIIFCETGLVVTPFLPGDSLLFAAGALAATGEMNVGLLWLLLMAAAIAGDSINYSVGHRLGRGIFKEDARVLKTEYLRRTEAFYEKYGGKTIVLARFIPIVRTYAPFVAGASAMNYARFLTYNVLGALLWVTLFLMGGFFFGNIPFVQKNFEYVVIVIVLLSVLPILFEYVKHRRTPRSKP